ncbi:hypothetical protein B566_EDAN018661 [Ephemera danica]|nr:hypothetical protein B566_EDAN018661 [Ephemera danica]
MRKTRPHLVYCSITGFGQTGPYRHRAGYDYAAQAMGGLMSVTGERDDLPGGGPQKAGVAVADLFTGMYATVAILAALRHAQATGQGQEIDLALLDSQVAMLANLGANYLVTGQVPGRYGNAHQNLVPYQVFEAADGHLVLAVGNDEQFRRCCEAKLQEVLHALVIDTDSDHNTQETAKRVAKMYLEEVFRGRYVPMPAVTEFPNVSRLNELMIVGPITVRSACSHHMCPIFGKVWIGILPNEHSNLIGLSKYVRIADWVMSRPQIQEEAVVMLADELQQRVQPDGLAIVMQADHFCMQWRGVKDEDSALVNSVMRGAFLKNPSLRAEFLALLARKQD